MKSLRMLLALFLIVLSTQGVWADKVTPTLELTPVDGEGWLDNDYKQVYPSWGNFTIPTVRVYTGSSESPTLLTSKYLITYYIDGHENDDSFSSDENGRQYTQDATTQTTITRYYGDVKVGSGAGIVTVRVVAKPKTAYADDYNETSATYKFEIVKVTPGAYSATPSSLTINVRHTDTEITEGDDAGKHWFTNVSSKLALPTTAITITKNGHVQDLSRVYDVTFAPKTGSEDYLLLGEGATNEIGVDKYIAAKFGTGEEGSQYMYVNEEGVKNPYATPVNATLVATFTPKPAYAANYNEVTLDIPVTIQNFSSNLDISLTLDGISASEDVDATKTAANTLTWSRWNDRTSQNEGVASHHLPKPVVIGTGGIDLSKHPKLGVCYFAVEDNTEYDDCQRTGYNPYGEIIEAGESTQAGVSRTNMIARTLNSNETLCTTYLAGHLKVGAFIYIPYPAETPDDSNIESWYNYTDETTIGNNSTYYTDGERSATYRRVSPIKYFYIDVLKRAPELVFNPDPTDVHYSTADHININNRFEVSGKIGDENDGSAGTLTYDVNSGGDTFWYSFEFDADAGIVVNNWPHYDRMEALDASGNKIEPVGYDWDNGGKPLYSGKVWQENPETHAWEEVQVDRTANIKSYRYYSVKGFGTDNLWDIVFTVPGTKEITYTVYPWNHAKWDKGTTKVQTYTIDAAKQTILNVDPQELVASINQDGFVEPEAWVTDAFDEEVSSDYAFSFEITDDGSTGTTVANDGGDGTGPKHEITIGGNTGDVTVKVTATTDNAKYDEGCRTLIKYYTIHVIETTGGASLYEIISSKDAGAVRDAGNTGTTDADYAKDKVMGKMHFIETGTFFAGYTISGVPGIDIRFGVYDGSTWTVKEDPTNDIGSYDNANDRKDEVNGKGNKFISDDTPVVLDENGIATGGHFYEFYAHTNGFLTVDARWEANHTYVLIDYDFPEYKLEFTPDVELKGEHTFAMAMLEDHSYHLYCTTGGQINMHGFSFSPAFIQSVSDTEPVTSGRAFMNNDVSVLPYLAKASMPTVTYSSDNEEKATINASTGKVKTVAITFTENPNYVTIRGKVKSQVSSLEDKVFKMPYYNLVIADIPTYRLGDENDPEGKDGFTNVDKNAIYVPDAGAVVTTYNISSPIRMTYGGWQHEYVAVTATGNVNRTDSYKAKGNAEIAGFTSSDKQFNKYIDGFTWSNVANQNPCDEKGSQNYKNYLTGAANMVDAAVLEKGYYKNTFTLPAKGAYWRFEPQTSGLVFVYLVQNGICSYTGDPHSLLNTDKNYTGLDWKPLYIVDETGLPVSTTADYTGLPESVKEFLGSDGTYTEGVIRCNPNDANVQRLTSKNAEENNGNVYDWSFMKKEVLSGFDVDYGGSTSNLNELHEEIKNTWTAAGDNQDIFQDPESKGYSLISKAYVRYAFNVKAGKSYWVFQNASKPNLCGFAFVPTNFPGANVTPKTATITDDPATDDFAKGSVTENVPYNVTYSGRTFTKKQWTSICLPFAVSEYEFHRVFGADAKIVTFDNLNDAKTNIHFVQHNYRMMEAGRPYFVYPDWEENKNELTFEGVTFEGKEVGNDYEDANKKVRVIEDKGLQFVGTYDAETMPQYSYFISSKDGNLKRVVKEEGTACGRYRAYLKNPNKDASLANIGTVNYEEPYEDVAAEEQPEPTTIVGVSDANVYDIIEGSVLKNGIYTLDGQLVSTNSKDVKNIPAGTYIVNGKKKVVK
ncbi:MAG: hypothetical protein IJV13_05275 [Prevotella sp.]|nr:hypothetical protein [Prevotella sp.]